MFRPQVRPADEGRARERVIANIVTFVLVCAAIRFSPMLLDKMGY